MHPYSASQFAAEGMHIMRSLISQIYRNRNGATAIEYGVIVALLAVVTLASLTAVGSAMNTQYNSLATSVTNAG